MSETGLRTVASVCQGAEQTPRGNEENFGDIDKKFVDVQKRVNEGEACLENLEKNQQEMERKLIDLQHQSTKNCLTFTGPEIPARQEGEDTQKLFCDLIQKKYNVKINPAVDLATFLKTGPSSAFQKIAHRHGKGLRNPSPEIKIYANVQLNKHDQKLRFLASQAKSAGTILFYETLPSGKIGILVSDKQANMNKRIPVNEYKDINPYITKEVQDSIAAMNKHRKQVKKTRKNNAEPMEQDFGEDDEDGHKRRRFLQQ